MKDNIIVNNNVNNNNKNKLHKIDGVNMMNRLSMNMNNKKVVHHYKIEKPKVDIVTRYDNNPNNNNNAHNNIETNSKSNKVIKNNKKYRHVNYNNKHKMIKNKKRRIVIIDD